MLRTMARFTLVLFLLTLLITPAVQAQRGGRNLSEANCALPPDQIAGQGFSSTAGAAGGSGADGMTPQGEDIEAEGLAANIDWVMTTLPYVQPGPESVAILVVDDFSADGSDDRPVSHGWLVLQVLEQLQAQLPDDVTDQITLEQVNIADENGYQSDLIQPAIARTIDGLAAQGIQRFVLNMSFVFIPCVDPETGFDFAQFRQSQSTNPALSVIESVGDDATYVRSLLEDSRVSVIEETGLETTDETNLRGSATLRGQERAAQVRRIPPTPDLPAPALRAQELRALRLLKSTRLQSDPLRDYLMQSVRGRMIVPVASAGNFKQREPFYPARWPEVVSVSANEGDDLRFWLQSNNGAISVPGAWFLFDDNVYRAGTSFAAPVVSMLVALDLTQTTPGCALQGGKPVLERGSYDNELISDVTQRFCRS